MSGSAADTPNGPRVAITGAGGFVGRRLTAALAAAHPEWVLNTPSYGPQGLDVAEPASVEVWIERFRPDMVVHLAAVSAVPAAVRDPRLAWRVNLDGTLNVVLALQEHAPDAHLLFVSSAEVYGASFQGGGSLDEKALLQPLNPYAASKAAADLLVQQAAIAGLSATIMRPFNHTGPGQDDAFVAPNFARQIARIEARLHPPVIEVGSLDDERDFLDVGDVVDAYILILDKCKDPAAGGVFNVASGRALRIGDLLECLLSYARLKIDVRVDPNRLRGASNPRMVGDARRLRGLGWSPRIPIEDTLRAVLDHEREVVSAASPG